MMKSVDKMKKDIVKKDIVIFKSRKEADIYFTAQCTEKIKVTFSYLNKLDFPYIAHDIFNILADNMEIIAPTGNKREDDYKCWYEAVKNGLKRDERHIILIKDNHNIIGFFQYYTNENTFVMEEIQIESAYQGKNIFRDLYGFIILNINADIEFVEAYANTANKKSIGILEHLGLLKIGMNKNGKSFHFKGSYANLVEWYKSKGSNYEHNI